MLKRFLVLALPLALGTMALPSDAAAQTRQIRLTNYGSAGTINTTEYGTVLASPYQGYFVGDPTTPLVDFFCIDFEHYAPPLNYSYNVRVTTLGGGSVAGTRHGAEVGALSKYQQIAWLIGHRPTVSSTNWRAIQLAVWQIFSGTCTSGRPNLACARNGDEYLNAMAASWRQAAFAQHDDFAASDYGNFKILTGVTPDGGRQEYMYVTPEPETYALMGMGLLTLFVAWRRRRRRTDDEAAFASGFAGI